MAGGANERSATAVGHVQHQLAIMIYFPTVSCLHRFVTPTHLDAGPDDDVGAPLEPTGAGAISSAASSRVMTTAGKTARLAHSATIFASASRLLALSAAACADDSMTGSCCSKAFSRPDSAGDWMQQRTIGNNKIHA